MGLSMTVNLVRSIGATITVSTTRSKAPDANRETNVNLVEAPPGVVVRRR